MKYPRALLVCPIIASLILTSLSAKEVPLWEGAAPGSKGAASEGGERERTDLRVLHLVELAHAEKGVKNVEGLVLV